MKETSAFFTVSSLSSQLTFFSLLSSLTGIFKRRWSEQVTFYWVNNTAIRELVNIDDFPNYTEILKALIIVLFCEENKTKSKEIRIGSQLGLIKWKWLSTDSHGLLPLYLWDPASVSWWNTGYQLEQFPVLWGQGPARGMEIFSVVLEGVRPAAREGIFFPPGLGADYKNCIVPQSPHQWVSSKAEKQL